MSSATWNAVPSSVHWNGATVANGKPPTGSSLESAGGDGIFVTNGYVLHQKVETFDSCKEYNSDLTMHPNTGPRQAQASGIVASLKLTSSLFSC
jgi:hypothetical protein